MSKIVRLFILPYVCMVLLSLPAQAGQRRLALVITNQNYPAIVGALANTHEDGRLIKVALERVGFVVTYVRDADKEQMRAAIATYIGQLAQAGPDGIGLLYYSGHGAAQSKFGDNYLIPTGARLSHAAQLPFMGIKLGEIIESLSTTNNRANFVIIDACRNVPFTRRGKSAYKGFRAERERGGVMIAYATEPGDIAVDENIYARALAGEIGRTEQTAYAMFRAVRRKVLASTGNRQFPWMRDGLVDPFYFGRAIDPEKIVLAQRLLSELGYKPGAIDGRQGPATDKAIHIFQGRMGLTRDGKVSGELIAALRTAKASVSQTASLIRPQKPPTPPTLVTPAGGIFPSQPKYRPGQVFSDRFKGAPKMVVLPAGSFMMGSKTGDSDEKLVHRVHIRQPFAVGKFEVTFDEWAACVKDGGCKSQRKPSDSGWGKGRRPVINVSWHDAREYVGWLNTKVKPKDKNGPYRLLSEAEWEYAARGGKGSRKFWWGNKIGSGNANCDGCGSKWDNQKTAPVGRFTANPFGLHDMHGNVWEWVEDCYVGSYKGAPTDGSARTKKTVDKCNARVLRGGSWYGYPRGLRSAVRLRYAPDLRFIYIGFRVARVVLPARTLQ